MIPYPKAKWQITDEYGPVKCYRLQFSDEYRIELEYNTNHHETYAWLFNKDKTVYKCETKHVTSAIQAMQWAGLTVCAWLHNTAIELKQMETMLCGSAGWKDLAGQNL